MTLTSKQKKFLRGLGQHLSPIASVGKAGLTPAVADSIGVMLDKHELIKVHIPAGGADDRQAMADELAKATGAQCVAQIGRMVVLYRPSEHLHYRKRIHLVEE